MTRDQSHLRSHHALFESFLSVTAHLNRELSIIPVLYGSLGLGRAIKMMQDVGDVDLLIPAGFLTDRWNELMVTMQRLQFVVVDVHEHAFQHGTDIVAFADEESLFPFAGINPSMLPVSTVDDIRFKELTPTDYLAVYQASQRDGYRQAKRGKRDAEKIILVKQFLQLGDEQTHP